MACPYPPGEKTTPTVVLGNLLSAAAVQVESPHSILGAQGMREWEIGTLMPPSFFLFNNSTLSTCQIIA
jgi:hypothetical protein